MSQDTRPDQQAPAERDRIRLAVVPGPLAGPLLSRVVGIAASRADLPVDRLDDALLVADAIAAHGPAHVGDGDGRLELVARAGRGTLELRVGPLRRGGARRLLEETPVPAAGNVIVRLASRTRIVTGETGDALVIDLEGAT